MKTIRKRILAFLLALIMFFVAVPFANFQKAEAKTIYSYDTLPDEMKDNVFLDALKYLGYDTDALVKSGYNPALLGMNTTNNPTGIRYWNGSYGPSAYIYARGALLVDNRLYGSANGSEETKAGKPDLKAFQTLSTQCGGYVNYVYMNYLHNVAGYDMSWYRSSKANDYAHVVPYPLNPKYWKDTLDNDWVPNGKAKRIYNKTTLNKAGDNYRTLSEIVTEDKIHIPIGSILIMVEKDQSLLYNGHIVIYMGCYNNTYYVAHITGPNGGGRGPEVIDIHDIEFRHDITKDDDYFNKRVIGIYTLSGSAKLNVTSNTPELTDNSPYYTFNGSEYTVFTKANDMANSTVGKFTLNKNGVSNSLDLLPGTYYYKETKAAKGYNLSTKVRSFKVTTGKKTSLSIVDTIDPAKRRFIDVNGSNVKGSDNYQYYYNAVYWARDQKIATGYSDNTYRPDNNCTRAILLIYLWRMAGSPTGYGDARKYFSDLGSYGTTSDVNKAAAWGYKTGIVKGTDTGAALPAFKPQGALTKKGALLMMYRYAGSPKVDYTLTFKDTATLSKKSEVYKALAWAKSNNIAAGFNNGTKCLPDLKCTRGRVVTYLYKARKLLAK